jgi:serine/tyrosine/threonine adenylyltransferase
MHRFGFDNTYARDLAGAYQAWQPAAAPAPRLLFANHALAEELGLPPEALQGADAAALFAGNVLPADAEPIAQAYAGHQFGGFSPQLGDGRALLLGELIDRTGQRRDIAFKGSGRTPFSRGGDGKAAVGPMLREVLMGEAMHALGIPTTRALAVAATGELVRRETPLPGGVLTRVAASHLRVGTFQFFAARGDLDMLRRLADYTIARHDPQLIGAPDRHLGLLRAVAGRQAKLIAQWLNVGFIHGVMNTDNMALSGETIDYGPCAFMEAYDPAAVFSSIDHNGRYAYANQGPIARWNLARFAETLLPLMVHEDDEPAIERAVADVTAVIDAFPALLASALLDGQRDKLGIVDASPSDDETDAALAADWLTLLHTQAVDFTLAWRHLASAAEGRPEPLRDLFVDRAALDAWLARWRERCGPDAAPRAERMRRASPAVIPRNHLVEEALAAATEGDLAPFEALLAELRTPWQESVLLTRYAAPAATEVTAGYRTFCGT